MHERSRRKQRRDHPGHPVNRGGRVWEELGKCRQRRPRHRAKMMNHETSIPTGKLDSPMRKLIHACLSRKRATRSFPVERSLSVRRANLEDGGGGQGEMRIRLPRDDVRGVGGDLFRGREASRMCIPGSPRIRRAGVGHSGGCSAGDAHRLREVGSRGGNRSALVSVSLIAVRRCRGWPHEARAPRQEAGSTI